MLHSGRMLGAACRVPGGLGAPGRRGGRLRTPRHEPGVSEFAQARLHGRRLSWPALDRLGPSRSEAEDLESCCSEHM